MSWNRRIVSYRVIMLSLLLYFPKLSYTNAALHAVKVTHNNELMLDELRSFFFSSRRCCCINWQFYCFLFHILSVAFVNVERNFRCWIVFLCDHAACNQPTMSISSSFIDWITTKRSLSWVMSEQLALRASVKYHKIKKLFNSTNKESRRGRGLDRSNKSQWTVKKKVLPSERETETKWEEIAISEPLLMPITERDEEDRNRTLGRLIVINRERPFLVFDVAFVDSQRVSLYSKLSRATTGNKLQ